jgi:hypothetical protein
MGDNSAIYEWTSTVLTWRYVGLWHESSEIGWLMSAERLIPAEPFKGNPLAQGATSASPSVGADA